MIKDLQKHLNRLSRERSNCFCLVIGRVQVINTELAVFYNHHIAIYKHIMSDVLRCPEIMTLLDIIHQFMQLHERLITKQKSGRRLEEVMEVLTKAIKEFDVMSANLVMRNWRHPRISTLVELKRKADKMFKMNLLIRQQTI
jgi:hypothetical protein